MRALVARGAQVVIADMNEVRGQALADELGAQARFVCTDVSREDDVRAALDAAVKLGELRAVFNCAGIAVTARVLDKTGAPHALSSFEKTLSVNLLGTFNMLRLGAAQMATNAPDADSHRGVIVNTASIAAFDGQVGQVAYSASKGAIVGLTLPAARDLAKHAIRVCTLCPGIMDTPLLSGLPEPARLTLEASVPFPSRLGLPAEFASLALHVVENNYLNGEVIRVDGALRMGFK